MIVELLPLKSEAELPVVSGKLIFATQRGAKRRAALLRRSQRTPRLTGGREISSYSFVKRKRTCLDVTLVFIIRVII